MKPWVFISILALMAILVAGCTTVPVPSQGQGQVPPTGTLTTGPVVTLPVTSVVDVLVMQKDSVYSTVDVVFGGGNGQVLVSSCNVVFTRSDGTSETRQLKPEKGATVTLQGTKGTDHVEVSVTMKDGKTYKIIDQQVPYRTRG
jgi:predicted small secreted protein